MRRIVFSLALALATLASITGSESQIVEGTSSSSFPYANSEDFLKRIQARRAELAATTSVPDSEIVLYTELGRLQNEIQAVSQALSAVFAIEPKQAQQTIAKYTQDIQKADSDISKIDCKDTAKYKDAADSFNRAIGAFRTYWPSAGGHLTFADSVNCEATKTRFNVSEHKDELNAFFEAYSSAPLHNTKKIMTMMYRPPRV